MYTHTHTHTHAYTHKIRAHTRLRSHSHTHTHTHTRTHTHAHTHTHTHTNTHTHTRTHTRAHTHTHTNTHKQTNTHAYTQAKDIPNLDGATVALAAKNSSAGAGVHTVGDGGQRTARSTENESGGTGGEDASCTQQQLRGSRMVMRKRMLSLNTDDHQQPSVRARTEGGGWRLI